MAPGVLDTLKRAPPGVGAVQKQKPEMIVMRNHKTSLPCRLRLSTLSVGALYLAGLCAQSKV